MYINKMYAGQHVYSCQCTPTRKKIPLQKWCHVVDEDEDTLGPTTAPTIADVIRRKQKEPNFILKSNKDRKGISKKAGNSSMNQNPSSSQLSVSKRIETRAEKLDFFEPFLDS